MRLGRLRASDLSQIFQLPLAIAATVGNIIYGKLDLTLGAILALTLSGGSWFGAKLAHAVPRTTLRGIVCGALVIIGLVILGNVGWRLIGRVRPPGPPRSGFAIAAPPKFGCAVIVNPYRSGALDPSRGAGFVAIHTDVEYDDIAPGAVAVSAEHRRQWIVQKEQKC
jgi:hypothetical protein